MKFHFFTVAAQTPESGQEALNLFCGQQRVVSVEKHFVAQGLDSFWTICVTTIAGSEKQVSGGKRDRIDYKETLSEQDFAVYAELRNLRKVLAEQEGVPAYALFTNEQLAEMVTRRVATLTALGDIDGIGKSRLEKYGEMFLRLLKTALSANSATKHETDSHFTG
jgi:superfamily II DNA helicase RecQ